VTHVAPSIAGVKEQTMQHTLRVLLTASEETGVPSYVHPMFDIWLRLVLFRFVRQSRQLTEADASWIDISDDSTERGA